MTRAPALRARSPVASADPSSITMTSCHGAAARSCATRSPIAAPSFMAGITTDTELGSANELFHDAIPGHGARAGSSGGAKARGKPAVDCEPVDGVANSAGFRLADESVFTAHDKFESTARVGCRDHRLAGQKCLERDIPIVFVERHIDDGKRSGVETHE